MAASCVRVVHAGLVGARRPAGGLDRLDRRRRPRRRRGGSSRPRLRLRRPAARRCRGRSPGRRPSPAPPGHRAVPSPPLQVDAATMAARGRCANLRRCTKAVAEAILAAFFANLGIAIAQVRRLGRHPVGQPPGRGRALPGRHRQPGAAAVRRHAGPPGKATPAHPFGYGRERYFWSFIVAQVLFRLGGAVRHLRGHREAPPPPRAGVAVVGRRHPPRRHRLRGLLLPDRGEGGQPRPQGRPDGCGSSADRSRPSCPSCSWRIRARSSASASPCSAWSWRRSPTTAVGTRWGRCPSASSCA